MIDPVPDIKKYPYLHGAYKDKKLIIFVGAGLSALWGCRRWGEMARALVDDCYEHGLIDFWIKEQLLFKYNLDPRKLITITKKILADKYIESLKNTLIPHRKQKFPTLFENLFALNSIFITTNIDDHLSCLFEPKNVYCDSNGFAPSVISPKKIFHLHGTINDPNSLVLTIDEYMRRYQNDNVKKFLQYIFFEDSFRLLFVGYGLDEMEIIDYMIEKFSEERESSERLINRFYMLLPFFQNEGPLFKYENSYFEQIKMTVIPYAIDLKGYDQLHEVIATWKTELTKPDEKNAFYTFTELIDRNL